MLLNHIVLIATQTTPSLIIFLAYLKKIFKIEYITREKDKSNLHLEKWGRLFETRRCFLFWGGGGLAFAAILFSPFSRFYLYIIYLFIYLFNFINCNLYYGKLL